MAQQKNEHDLSNFRTGHGRGIKCPACSTFIEINPVSLVAGLPAICSNCHLELMIDPNESAEAMKALQKLVTGVNQAEEMYKKSTMM